MVSIVGPDGKTAEEDHALSTWSDRSYHNSLTDVRATLSCLTGYSSLYGMSIQDVWIPEVENAPPGAAMGTNLRVYNAEDDSWEMVWTTETLGGFQTFKSRMTAGNMVMNGDLPAGRFPAHMARITFHNISAGHFDWKYEASLPGDGEEWQLQSTLSCDRQN